MAMDADVRNDLGADARCPRLGAVPLRPLDLEIAVGLDLDRRYALGLRALSLRALGASSNRLGVGARSAPSPGRVCARARALDTRASRSRAWRVVSARTGG